jgi:hypothetical protein
MAGAACLNSHIFFRFAISDRMPLLWVSIILLSEVLLYFLLLKCHHLYAAAFCLRPHSSTA